MNIKLIGGAASASSPSGDGRLLGELAIVGVGLLIVYVPTFIDVARTFWAHERGTSGPIIIAAVLWMLWQARDHLRTVAHSSDVYGGCALLAAGLTLFSIGRSQQFYQIEVGSLIPTLAGIVLMWFGRDGLKVLWFPILFLLLAIPLPGSLLDSILLPLKEAVSSSVATSMQALGFPVARSGVVLTIGQYQLLIADACSGLNSMMALTGVGLFYVYVAKRANVYHNMILLVSEIPIAFLVNVFRVVVLLLGTYWFGEDVGAVLHGVMQYVQMALTFACFFLLDWILGRVFRAGARARSPSLGNVRRG